MKLNSCIVEIKEVGNFLFVDIISIIKKLRIIQWVENKR